jgi:hypothetical protein
LLAIRRTDMNQLRLRDDGFGYMRVNLRLIAGRVGAGVLLVEVGKQKLVMTCALGASDTASGGWHKLTVLLAVPP